MGRRAGTRTKAVAAAAVVLVTVGMLALPAGAAKPTSPPGQAPIVPPGQPADPGNPTPPPPGSGGPSSPVDMSIGDATVGEADGSASLTISLAASSAFPTTVDWATADGTAGAGSDYTSSSATATIPAGATSTSVSVPILDDTEDESAETFSVVLSNASGNAVIADGTGVVTITDDDDPVTTGPTLSVDDATVIEGLDAIVTIRLSEPATAAVNISGQVNQGTATTFDDYLLSGFTTGILTGQQSVDVLIPTFRGPDTEPETFTVVVSTTDVDVTDDTGVVTIVDDPQSGALTCADDGFEPDDDETTATNTGNLPPAFVATARACPEDPDVFAVPQALGATVTVEVLYDTGAGDLGVQLLRDGEPVATGTPFTQAISAFDPSVACASRSNDASTDPVRTGECLTYQIPTEPGAPLFLAIEGTGGPDAGIPYVVNINIAF